MNRSEAVATAFCAACLIVLVVIAWIDPAPLTVALLGWR